MYAILFALISILFQNQYLIMVVEKKFEFDVVNSTKNLTKKSKFWSETRISESSI